MLLLNRARAVTFSVMAFASGLTWMPDVSFARDGWGGFAAGVIAGGIMRGFPGGGGGGGGGRHRGGGGEQTNNGGGSNQGKQPQIKYAAQDMKSANEVDANRRMEEQRDVSAAVTKFIKELKDQHANLERNNANIRGASRGGINQITEGEIRLAVDKAYQEGHLDHFETLAGELWTRDRLQVQILLEAQKGILPYFNGVGAKGPDMTNLEQVFKESADKVYSRALELAEIIGVSRSFDRFIRTIYENSDQAPAGLWTVGADLIYERMLTNVINEVDRDYFAVERLDNQRASTLSGRLAQQFSFRFRSRRALYDCVTANYSSLITNGGEGSAPYGGGSVNSQAGGLIQTSRTGSKSVSKDGVINAVEGSNTSEDVWKRTRKLVETACKEIARPWAQNATAGLLRPIAARTDLAVNAGMTFNRSEGQYVPVKSGE